MVHRLSSLIQLVNKHGIIHLTHRLWYKIKQKPIDSGLFEGKSGLEIGGPSSVFQDNGTIPIYKLVKNVDGCNFSNDTLWEGQIKSGANYNFYKNKSGYQYLSDGTNLSEIPDSIYEFVISSNCLEHIANPLKALNEWVRVLQKGGMILLVLPNKKYNFDHKRQITKFEHILEDYTKNTGEDDLFHLEEIIQYHDLSKDPAAGDRTMFKTRSENNFQNRALHHHVFNIDLLKQIFNFLNLEIIATYEDYEYFIIGKK